MEQRPAPEPPFEQTEENQRPFDPQEEQQFEPTSVDSPTSADAPARRRPPEAPPGRQVSGQPPASATPLEGEGA